MSIVRWNISVSADTDQALRLFLARNGGGRKGDLSRFIEEAVRLRLSQRQAGVRSDNLENLKSGN